MSFYALRITILRMYRYRCPSPLPRILALTMAGIVGGLGFVIPFFGLPRVTAVSPEGDSASSLAPLKKAWPPVRAARLRQRLNLTTKP